MVKTIFKLLLAVLIYTVIFSIANNVLPFSVGFKELAASGSANPLMSVLFIVINAAWTCFVVFFLIKHSSRTGKKLFLNVLCVIFFIQCFMTQIETLYFSSVFPALTTLDAVLIMAAGLLPLLAVIPLLIKFFQNKDAVQEKVPLNIKSLAIKLGILSVIYVCVYMVFGYFVAWQFKDLRIFYSGSPDKLSFFEKLLDNIQTDPLIFPFQILRGVLFGLFIIPLKIMISKSRAIFIASVCLVYLCTALMLIIPNPLFPDPVRFAHLLEMTSSMLLFGLIAGFIFWGRDKTKSRG